jgi:hypothetical protein
MDNLVCMIQQHINVIYLMIVWLLVQIILIVIHVNWLVQHNVILEIINVNQLQIIVIMVVMNIM